MDGNAPRRGAARGWLVGLLLVALLAAVGVASSGAVPSGSGAARRPSEQLLDVTMSVLAVLVVVGGVIAVVVFALFRRDESATTSTGGRRRRTPGQALATLLLGLVFVILALRFMRSDDGPRGGDGLLPGLDRVPGVVEAQDGRYEPEFTVWPVVVVAGLVLAAAAAVALRRRAARRAAGVVDATEPETALADVLDETLDDLRDDADARRVVIRAYARMEQSMGAVGLPRREAEAPEEYLDRLLTAIEIDPGAAARLTHLFTWARFSGHDVRPEMKGEAIETLQEVRDGLRVVVAQREAAAAARLAGAPA
jgi:NADH:ubiquinone oxidoreductase subunit 6 (subunit J)